MTDYCDLIPDDPSCWEPIDTKPDSGGFDKDGGGFDKDGGSFDKDGDLGPIDDDKLGHEDLDDHLDKDMMPTGRLDGKMSWEDVEATL